MLRSDWMNKRVKELVQMKNENFENLSAEDRKRFAQEQLQFLKNQGIVNSLRLSRIFKAAGPGQVKAAWELANQAQTQVRKDMLDCLLTGSGGCQNFGHERMNLVLKEAGFTVPVTSSNKAFFRMLDGAIEILVPGSYEFTSEELKEIEEGLERSKERAKQFVQQTAV